MRKLALVIALLLISATLLESTSIVKANSSPIIEWKGWWVGSDRVTFALSGQTVGAKVRIDSEPSGHYRIRILRDIANWPDSEVSTLEFDYDGSDSTYNLNFVPTIATDEQNTRGYHVDVCKKELLVWIEKWTLVNFYPPRLRVFSSYTTKWTYYHSYSEIESGLRSLESSGIAKVVSIGISVEGRQIWAAKISNSPDVYDKNKPDILFVGLHHAREWISAETSYYLAINLVNRYSSETKIKTLVDNCEIWIVPVLNPDGLEYSQAGVWDPEIEKGIGEYGDWSRYYRKNRSTNSDGTHGVDLNRNYGHSKWGTTTYMPGIPFESSSGTPKSGCYYGPSAFSEPETVAIENLILDDKNDFGAVLSYHSFGQYILYPWGVSKDPTEDQSVMSALANEMADQIHAVHGVQYTVGQASTTIYETSGDLTDWVYEAKGIPALTIELRPGPHPWWALWEQGKTRFALAENEILPTCEENWPAALYLINWVVLSQGGFMDFEDGVDDVPIRSTIPGMKFTTTMGYDWIYGDIRTGRYNVDPYGSRAYECHGNVFAWLGPNQGSGRIDFTGATAGSISMLTSTAYGTYLDAYDSSANLLARSFAGGNIYTGTMSEIRVVASDIAYVIVHDSGNYWLIDDLRVSDLLRETSAFQSQDSVSVFQTLDLIDSGASSTYEFSNSQLQSLKILLNWKGSKLGIQISGPDGTVFAETESENPPIRIVVPAAEPGTWRIVVTALDVPYNDYPFALDVASVPLPSDIEPPATTLEMGSPKFTDSSDNIYVTSSTPFTLTAEDNADGSGVATTGYCIRNADSYDSGWTASAPPIEFYLTGLVDGEYFIDFNSTDNVGNVEGTNTQALILDNTAPLLTVETPAENDALQDGVTFKVSAWDLSAVASVTFSIQCPQGNVISPEFQSMPATLGSNGKWSLYFDTRKLPDGFYLFVANGTDVLGNWGTTTVDFSIRNWAAIELLPASENNKAGRTMPVKFSIRVKASVDPARPFIYNEELTIKIYKKASPSNILLRTSTFGTAPTDYWIDTASEKYHTNFKTLSTPATYVVEIWRKGVRIGSFEFKTVK